MTDKKKVLFVNDEMRMGGVARVLNTLMKTLPKDQYEIDLLVLHKEGMMLDSIPDNVNVIEGTPFFKTVDQPLKQLVDRFDVPGILSKCRLIFYMKTGLIEKKIQKERSKMLHKQYDVEMAAKEGFCTIFTAFGDSKKKLNWVLTDYSVCNYSSNHMKLLKKALDRIDLNIADSKKAMVAYEEVFGIHNGISIHNLMDVQGIEKALNAPSDLPKNRNVPALITVARFHPQKSLDRMIKASHYAYQQGYIHTLYLIGGGELDKELRKLVSELQMKHVVFLGYSKNPYPNMKEADLFVLSSLYEGFATVISESLIVGTPVLTTNVSGCEEQITSSDHGWIVDNNQEALNEGFVKALSNLKELQRKKEALQKYRYPNDEILKEFMDVL